MRTKKDKAPFETHTLFVILEGFLDPLDEPILRAAPAPPIEESVQSVLALPVVLIEKRLYLVPFFQVLLEVNHTGHPGIR